MVDATKNDARITARIPQSIKETLEQAAIISGSTLNQFIVQAALKEAQTILDTQRIINLSEADGDRIFSLLENPPVANERLKTAVQKHQEFFREGH
ncbi:MAG: DUF1778 domain-containing protein [Waterburya sp.]